ncbi:MAG: DUF1318 domain-containing protein [Magnetococcales bacterium]|nr:DUF1318 domain-containing protein [Magnetococcales bacterium]
MERFSFGDVLNRTVNQMQRGCVVLAGVILLAGCGGPLVEVSVVDERTAIENQILGTYAELNQEMLLVASVRSIDSSGKLVEGQALPDGKLKVVRALQRSSFNRDDIVGFKKQAILGENNQGGLSILKPEALEDDQRPFLTALIEQENADRLVLMHRVIATDEKLTEADLDKVQKIFAAMNRDKALPGQMVQDENGRWISK